MQDLRGIRPVFEKGKTRKKPEGICKPGSVPRRKSGAAAIHLGPRLPAASSSLPGSIGRAVLKRFPIWPCSGWGLPSRSGHPNRW